VTIAVCVPVPEGIVLAAESRQVYLNEKDDFRVVSDNAQKVFQLSPVVGGLTYGQAAISGTSILSLVELYKVKSKSDTSPAAVKAVADGLSKFLDEKWKNPSDGRPAPEGGNVGLIVAWFDQDGSRRVFECSVPGPSVVETSAGAIWKGQRDVIARLLLGKRAFLVSTRIYS